MKPAERCDAVVIGAGFAGLAAALALERHGLDVQVLEAQAQVGGRIRSIRRPDGIEEAGGATIGGGYRAVIEAAERYGVELIDATPMLAFFREQDLLLRGELIRQADWPAHPANAFPEQDKHLPPWSFARLLTARRNPLPTAADWLEPQALEYDIAFADWLRGEGLCDAAIDLAHGLNPSYGADASDVSALTMLARAAFSKDQRSQTPAGVVGYTAARGVQRIPEAMAAALRREVRLDAAACVIEDASAHIEVRCQDASRFRAQHVVCAVPFPALSRIRIDPPLQGAQREAVDGLPSQPMTQLYFTARTNFWEQDGYAPSLFSDGPAGMFAAARRAESPAEVTGLTAWAMGRHALRLDALPEADAAAVVIGDIESARPAARGQLEYVGRQSWGSSPFAGGGWAYFRPGQVRRFAANMGKPHGRLHFCGEHLAHRARGMEGAMESGERAAAEILRR